MFAVNDSSSFVSWSYPRLVKYIWFIVCISSDIMILSTVHWNDSGFMDTLHLELSATGTDVQTTTVFPYFVTVGAPYEQNWDLR